MLCVLYVRWFVCVLWYLWWSLKLFEICLKLCVDCFYILYVVFELGDLLSLLYICVDVSWVFNCVGVWWFVEMCFCWMLPNQLVCKKLTKLLYKCFQKSTVDHKCFLGKPLQSFEYKSEFLEALIINRLVNFWQKTWFRSKFQILGNGHLVPRGRGWFGQGRIVCFCVIPSLNSTTTL